ncbi:MAG: Ig-like domain-containing protein [Chloroflexi bacterium]|nr:Ig-like domain-containing protein [Chloroflexota bacterium]
MAPYNEGHSSGTNKCSIVKRLLFIVIAAGFLAQSSWSGDPIAVAQEGSQGRLTVTVAPPVLTANEGTHAAVYLQLQDASGAPTIAQGNIEVSLSSSDNLVASVPSSAVIQEGRSYATVSLTTTAKAGRSDIIAAAEGFALASGEVRTVNPLGATTPLRLVLYASPGRMIVGGEPPGRLTVVLLGSNGRLAPAADDLDVVLSSSAPGVVRVARRVTIQKGLYFATVDIEPLSVGSATLSALSSGFVSEFADVEVSEPGEAAEALALYLAPPTLPSGIAGHPGVVVQAVDSRGKPVPFPCTEVFLTTSSPLSVEVPSDLQVPCDEKTHYVPSTLSTGDIPGRVTLSTGATGLRPDSESVEVQGQIPVQLKAYLAPQGLMAAEATPGFAVVQAQDSAGAPVTLHSGIPVRVVGGGDALPDEVIIPRGQSYATVSLAGLEPDQQIDLSLVSPGLSPAPLSVKLRVLSLSVDVVASGGPLFPGEQAEVLVLVQSGGRPLTGARLSWSATNGTLGLSDSTLETDEQGGGRAVFLASSPGDGVVQVTASKAGYKDTQGQVSISIVQAADTGGASPRLFGIPVVVLFFLVSAALLGYLGYRLWPAISGHRGTNEDESED